jgi:hypothetical protein
MFRLPLRIRSDVEQVVHWMPGILFAAEIASVVCTDACPSKKRIYSSSPPRSWHGFSQVRHRSCGALCSKPPFSQ